MPSQKKKHSHIILAVIIEVCEATTCIQIKTLETWTLKGLFMITDQVIIATRVLKMND